MQWQKTWYGVTEKMENKEMILTLININKEEICFGLDKPSLERTFKTLKSLKHPFIHPVERCEYNESMNMLAVFRPFSAKGSLKDLLYKGRPKDPSSTKYSGIPRGLKENEILTFGRQILEGLLYLKKKGYPMPHLHSGNLILTGSVLQISDYENSLVCLDPLYSYFLPNVSVELQCFGKVLFEMMTGSAGDGAPDQILQNTNFISCKMEALKQVVTSIFKLSGEAPLQVEDLLKGEPFAKINLNIQIPKATLSQKTADFLTGVRNKNDALVSRINLFTEDAGSPREVEIDEKKEKELRSSVRMPGTKRKKKPNKNRTNTTVATSSTSPNRSEISITSPPPKTEPKDKRLTQSVLIPNPSNVAVPPPPPISRNISQNAPPSHPPPPPPTVNAPPPPTPPPPPPVTNMKELPPPQEGRNDLLASIRNVDKNKLLKKTKK